MTGSGILCVGEALVDVVRRGDDVAEHVGGSPLNVACGLARLGHDTTLATWIGRDARGDAIRQAASDAGVRLSPGSDGAERTPVAQAVLDEEARATYSFDLTWDLPPLEPGEWAHLHVGSIGATLEPGGEKVLELVRSISGTVSYDPNARPAIMGSPAEVLGRIEAIIAASDLVKASDEDVAWLLPDLTLDAVAARWLGLGAGLVVVTRGGEGAAVWTADGARHDAVPHRVAVADTVGAGDSFMAGLVSGLVDLGFLGGPGAAAALRAATWPAVEPALVRAMATAAITVGRAGAYGPTRDEVAQFVAG